MGLGKSNYQAPEPQDEFKILGEQVDLNNVITTLSGQVAWKDDLLFVRAKGDNGQFVEWQRYINQNALVEEIVSFINDMKFSGIAVIAKESLLKIISDRVYNEFKD